MSWRVLSRSDDVGNLRAVLRRHIFCIGVASSFVGWLVSQKVAASNFWQTDGAEKCLEHGAMTRRADAQSWLSQLPLGTVFHCDTKRIKRTVQDRDSKKPNTTQDPSTHFRQPSILHAFVSQFTVRFQSIILTPRVSFEVDSETPQSHSSSIVHRVVHFRYDGPIIRSDTCAFHLQHDQSWLVQDA